MDKIETFEIIKHYQNLLEGEKFYVRFRTTQLLFPGILNDINIVVVKPTKDCNRLVKKLMKENPSDTFINGGEVSASFMHGDKKINVFFLKYCDRTTIPSGHGFDYDVYGLYSKLNESNLVEVTPVKMKKPNMLNNNKRFYG